MSNFALEVENLSKKYQLGELERYYTFRDTLTNIVKAPFRKLLSNKNRSSADSLTPNPSFLEPSTSSLTPEFIWALKDVSFQVKHGEVLGIIGRNGAGKSTLLKIISRITAPTEGTVKINGSVGSLLEVGTGFHPELTGRENIFLNGSILGMSRKEINKKFDEIVDFAEVEKFIDTPVKRYSSGMYLRLAFAVAAHLDPEILIVDEVLAVGDIEFQRKCVGKMSNIAEEGRTVLFVSHNVNSIQQLCTNGLILNKGNIIFEGDSKSSVKYYLDILKQNSNEEVNRLKIPRVKKGVFVNKCEILNHCSKSTTTLNYGEEFSVQLEIKSDSKFKNLSIYLGIDTIQQARVTTVVSSDNEKFYSIESNEKLNVIIIFNDLVLSPGSYFIYVAIRNSNTILDEVINFSHFEISNLVQFGTKPHNQTWGLVKTNVQWK